MVAGRRIINEIKRSADRPTLRRCRNPQHHHRDEAGFAMSHTPATVSRRPRLSKTTHSPPLAAFRLRVIERPPVADSDTYRDTSQSAAPVDRDRRAVNNAAMLHNVYFVASVAR